MPQKARPPEFPCPSCCRDIFDPTVGFVTKNQWTHKFMVQNNRVMGITEGVPENDAPESAQAVYCGCCGKRIRGVTKFDLTMLANLTPEELSGRLNELIQYTRRIAPLCR